jgi:nucleoside-diphosphate-sugar epimerase
MQQLVVITGGAGFIGSHLAEGFLDQGYAIRVIDNLSTGSLANLARVKDSADFRLRKQRLGMANGKRLASDPEM